MVVPAIASVVGAFGWFTSMPNWAKYLIFITGLTLDTGIEQLSGYGVMGSLTSYLAANIFGMQGVVLASWQILTVAIIFPFFVIVWKSALSYNP